MAMIGGEYPDALNEVWRSSRVAWLRVRIGSAVSGWWFQMALTAWAGWGARLWLLNRATGQPAPNLRGLAGTARHVRHDRVDSAGNG
jgi:hypothetical protein